MTISLDLYNDETITFTTPSGNSVRYERTQDTAVVTRSSESNVTKSWNGMSEFRSANVISNRRNGDVETYTGSFVIEDHVCNLNYMNGEQVVSCQHRSTYPPKMAPRVSAPLPKVEKEDHEGYLRSPEKVESKVSTSTSSSSTIDIMVLWTKNAECALSGKGKGCNVNSSTKSTMEDLVDLAIEETNTAYSKSNIKAQLRLVHSYRDDYVEPNNAFDNGLDYITWDSNDVKNKREQYKADVVAMLIDDNQYCGIGWIGPRKDLMYSVTGWNCATGTYTFGHEVGHNMGCGHDRGSDRACNLNQNPGYAYGWRDPQGDWGTVMSYSCNRNECDNNPSSWCGEIQRFSSSTVKYQGKALGDQYNDCARQHNDVRSEVANYFNGGNGGGGGGGDCGEIAAKKECKAEASCSWRKSDKTCIVNCSGIVDKSVCESENACKWKNKANKCKGTGSN